MFKILFPALALLPATLGYVVLNGTACTVFPESAVYNASVDDTPSILQAFDLCGIDGSISFPGPTYNVEQVMNTTNLRNVEIDIYGELIWSTDIPYWLSHSIPVVYSNLSTAWLFGGTNVTLRGHGPGPHFNGNGQLWYDENMGQGNQPGRPIAITFYNNTNLYVEGLTWTQSQFWHSFISHSQNVTMTAIYMNSTSNDGNDTVNTDGTDTWNSQDLVLTNWTVQNGDDCISVKGNSSNVYVANITCYGSGAMPIGSVGENPATPDFVQDILFEDVVLYDSSNAAWIKTWQGQGSSAAGGTTGGGGGGFVRNVTWRNFQCNNVDQPIYVTQCIYGGDPSVCDTSLVNISDIYWQNITGTSRYNVAGSLHCSSAQPCSNLVFEGVDITSLNSTGPSELYLCANILNQNTTSNIPCGGFAPNDFPQQLTSNYAVFSNGSVEPVP